MKIDEFIRYMNGKKFYHFTDIRNLPSIREHGLLSLRQLNEKGIEIPAPGGNDWSHEADERIGLDGHVHLCLWSQHPMEYVARQQGRIEQSRFLRINPDVLHTPDIKFSPDVSNKADVPIYSFEEAIKNMDFAVVYTRTDWKDPAVQARLQASKKFELLIPSSVDLKAITGLE